MPLGMSRTAGPGVLTVYCSFILFGVAVEPWEILKRIFSELVAEGRVLSVVVARMGA
jgi:hypothetical protein